MTALELISNFIAAIDGRNCQTMSSCRPADFALDWVHGDAYDDGLLGVEI